MLSQDPHLHAPHRDGGAIAALRRFANGAPRGQNLHRCTLCNLPLPEGHRHLLEVQNEKVECACDACALLFPDGGRFKVIPRDAKAISVLREDGGLWRLLGIPVDLAFFVYSRREEGMVARYPSPAGVTEFRLSQEGWERFCAENPLLARMEQSVEALLVHRARQQYFIAPIDVCYELVGLVRMHWKGFTGGAVWEEIDVFFETLRRRSRPAKEVKR